MGSRKLLTLLQYTRISKTQSRAEASVINSTAVAVSKLALKLTRTLGGCMFLARATTETLAQWWQTICRVPWAPQKLLKQHLLEIENSVRPVWRCGRGWDVLGPHELWTNPKLFFSFHMTSVAWLLYWGGAVCRTHLSGVTGDYDWVAACRAPEVIPSGALISTMTIVAPHPTQPHHLPTVLMASSTTLVRAVFGTAAVALHVHFPSTRSHTLSVSLPVTLTCFFRCCTQLARNVATFSQCVTLWVKPFELVIQTACLNRAAKKQVFILLPCLSL